MPEFMLDPLTSSPGCRPSGAPLYHRGSIFTEPVRCRVDRAHAWRIMASAEALDRRTRAPGQHGGVLKAKGLDVLRALLRRFYNHVTSECFPSYDEIAQAAGCCRATVAAKLRILEQLGFIETIRRKVVTSFVSRVHRVRFDVAVQTSNSYTFSLPIIDRDAHGDTALTLLKPERVDVSVRVFAPVKTESKFRAETSRVLESRDVADLAAEKARWIAALLSPNRSC